MFNMGHFVSFSISRLQYSRISVNVKNYLRSVVFIQHMSYITFKPLLINWCINSLYESTTWKCLK
jgi:hypothetical protein